VLYSQYGLGEAFGLFPVSPLEAQEEEAKRLRERDNPQVTMALYEAAA
jgi:hypothetical protein